jgi:hypothetical protein
LEKLFLFSLFTPSLALPLDGGEPDYPDEIGAGMG